MPAYIIHCRTLVRLTENSRYQPVRGMRYLRGDGLGYQPMKILIADDKPHMRRVIRGLLESHPGWDVAEAEDGVQAVTRAKQDKPDVVVLDLAMPELNGFEAARQIASALPGVHIFLNTLYAFPQVERE